MKIFNLLRLSMYFGIIGLFLLLDVSLGLAFDLELEKTVNLTEKGSLELRPEIHIIEKDGGKHIFVVRRKVPKPFLLREFFFSTGKQGREILLFPQDENTRLIVTDFGSLFVNGKFYIAAQSTERKQDKSFSRESGFREKFGGQRGRFGNATPEQRERGAFRGRGRSSFVEKDKGIMRIKLLKFDKDFSPTPKSAIILEESPAIEKSLVSGGKEVNSLIVNAGDDPGIVSDGEKIYIITELRKRGKFEKNEPQYRVHAYDLDINPLWVKDIVAGRFNGGFQKLVCPIYHNKKFLLLGEFIPEGYGDPDLPPWLRNSNSQPMKKNKDLFVMQYDRNWNPIGNGWQLTKTFPGMEYYATGFVPYKDHFFVTYSFATDIKSKHRGILGDGEMHLSIFDQEFKRIKDIKISAKISTQGNLAIFGKQLLMVYSERDIPEMPLEERVNRGSKRGFKPTRADIIMKIFKIVE